MELVLSLGFYLLFGVVCAVIAESRGRSALAWFFIGFFLPCIGLVLLFALPDVEAENRKHQELRMENRRLRELVRKDRQVADARHVDLARRLEVHDRALGVDTASPAPLLLDPLPALHGGGDASAFAALDWYYVAGGEAKGPVRFDDLRRLRREGVVHERSLLWHDGLADWLALADIPGLAEECRG